MDGYAYVENLDASKADSPRPIGFAIDDESAK